MFYITFGILTLAVAVSQTREALLEAVVVSLQKRIRGTAERDRNRRISARWRDAVSWHLTESKLPVWVPSEDTTSRRTQPWTKRTFKRLFGKETGGTAPVRLNIEGLTQTQLEAAAREAGTSLDDLLAPDPAVTPISPIRPPLTHVRIGNAARVLTSFSLAFAQGSEANALLSAGQPNAEAQEAAVDISLTVIMEREEQLAFYIRLAAALTIFVTFWLVCFPLAMSFLLPNRNYIGRIRDIHGR